MAFGNVSVVIPSWNGRKLLERCIPSVLAATEHYRQQTGAITEIIVVEDGGTDDTAEWLRSVYGPRVTLVNRPVRGGFGNACNTGFESARGPIILLLNNDVTLAPAALTRLASHFDGDRLFAVTCKAMEPQSEVVSSGGRMGEFRRGFWRVFRNYDPIGSSHGRVTEYPSILASGGFSAFDLEKLRALGGFNPLFSPFYWEDVDLSLRAWHRGWKILYEPSAEVRHAASSTIGPRFRPDEVRRISQRNRMMVHWIHLQEVGPLCQHLLGLAGLLTAAVFKFDWPVLQGFADALRQWPKIRCARAEEREARTVSGRALRKMFSELRKRSDLKFFSSREEFLKFNAGIGGSDSPESEVRCPRSDLCEYPTHSAVVKPKRVG